MAGTYPDPKIARTTSARQQSSLDYVHAERAQDTSLRACAAANGLSSSSLDRAHRRLKRRGLLKRVQGSRLGVELTFDPVECSTMA